MTSFFESLRQLLISPRPLPAGTYPYQSPPDAERPYRLHLRLDQAGEAVLIVNAATVLHLNQTAAEYVYHFIHGVSPEEIARLVSRRYKAVTPEQALEDYQDLFERINTLALTNDLDPVMFLDYERTEPYLSPAAPYRLDCALTYRLPADSDAAAAPQERVRRELDTAEWLTIIDKAWAAGIPHLVFTGGEPTLRSDLTDLLHHAEGKGQVTGLLTDGLLLANPDYLNALLQTGLDHLVVVLQPDNPQSWQALEQILPVDLFTCVHLTLTPENLASAGDLLKRLKALGANAVSLSASQADLLENLAALRDRVAELDLELVWSLPVPYSALNPVSFEVQAESAPGAGRAWLYVEPDGDVLPAQGINQTLGNLLTDSWENIWAEQ